MFFGIEDASRKLLDGGCLVTAWLIVDAQMKRHELSIKKLLVVPDM